MLRERDLGRPVAAEADALNTEARGIYRGWSKDPE
jgi:hypothetical protein